MVDGQAYKTALDEAMALGRDMRTKIRAINDGDVPPTKDVFDDVKGYMQTLLRLAEGVLKETAERNAELQNSAADGDLERMRDELFFMMSFVLMQYAVLVESMHSFKHFVFVAAEVADKEYRKSLEQQKAQGTDAEQTADSADESNPG